MKNKNMVSTFLLLLCIAALVAQIACIYPKNMTVNKDFRQLTVSFHDILDFNKIGDETLYAYKIVVQPVDLPSYFLQFLSYTILTRSPTVTFKDLISNARLRLKIALKKTHAEVQECEYSPWYQLAVKTIEEAGNVLIPGKVQNLKAIENPDKLSIRNVILTFDDPSNLQLASDANDKSVQYRIKACTHNIFNGKNADCNTLTEFVRKASSVSQTTESLMFRPFYYSNIFPSKEKDIAFVVTAISLNGTEGPAEQVVRRLNPRSKPGKPTALRSSYVCADELELTWTQSYSFATAYIRYNIIGDAAIQSRTSSINSTVINGLKPETTYEFQVGLYTTNNGGSDWSDVHKVTTPSTFSLKHMQKDYRQLSVSFDQYPDFNKSGDATQNLYEFNVSPVDLPTYFVNSSYPLLTRQPTITLNNLLTNSKLRLRIALKKTDAPVQECKYSPWYHLAVKNAAEAGHVLIPGKVLNLNAINNPDKFSVRSVIITFDDPSNVQLASDADDKSVQYRVKACTHNIFNGKNTGCKTLTEFVRNASSVNQTTETLRDNKFYVSNIHPNKKNEMAFVVTGISLNGTEGPSEQVIRRLNSSSKPAKPTALRSSDVYANQLKLTWTQSYTFATAYIRYNIIGNLSIQTKTSSINSAVINGLEPETTYEFQVGLYTTNNGGSDWSDIYKLTTAIACIYPKNMTVTKDFRQLTVSFHDIPDFNKSGEATQHLYEFDVRPVDLPSYVLSYSSYTILTRQPTITLNNLLSNAKFRLRFALRKTNAPVQECEYSPWYHLAVKKATEAGNVLIPGKVLNLSAINNPDKFSIRSAIITFDDPTNVQLASDADDKSVQYRVKACTHNIFNGQNTDCQTLTEFGRRASDVSQTTESLIHSKFYFSNIYPSKEKDMAFVVIAISLNGTEGPAEQVVRRLNPGSKPAKATALRSSDVYDNQLKLTWTQSYTSETAYIRYNIIGKPFIQTNTSSIKSAVINGLQPGTTYGFKVGLYTAKHGASDWSEIYKVTTRTSKTSISTPRQPPSAVLISFLVAIVSVKTFV